MLPGLFVFNVKLWQNSLKYTDDPGTLENMLQIYGDLFWNPLLSCALSKNMTDN